MTTAPPPQENAGLSSLVETIVAPASAFDRLAEKQTWGWAFIASSILAAVGALASAPVNRHLAEIILQQRIASAPTAQQASAIASAGAIGMKFSQIGWIFTPLIMLSVVLFATVILFLVGAIFGGKATFKQLWCAAMNVSVVYTLGVLVTSIVAALRGPDVVTNMFSYYRDSVTLAAAIPTANVKVLVFLAAISPFSLWQLWLNSLLMQRIARLAAPKAWAAALAVLLVPALVGAAFAPAPPAPASGAPSTSASASP